LAFDRETTLKKAEKLLRQGRLEGAIAEYIKVVEDQPSDWNSANALGDLYARAGQTDKAVSQFSRIAEHFSREGFYQKAAALLKKILKINRDDEVTEIRLAEVSALQGLMADAKAQFTTVAARRRARGDRRGEAEIVVRLGEIDPADLDARRKAARALEDLGRIDEAAVRHKALHDDLTEKGRSPEALEALREFSRLRPSDPEARGAIARAALEAGDVEGARTFLGGDASGDDPALLLALAEANIRSGNVAAAIELLPRLVATGGDARDKLVELGWAVLPQDPVAAFGCIDAAVDAAVGVSEFEKATALLERFLDRVPRYIPALLKLVEVCVDGGLESRMYAAQESLTDAYLDAGQAAEARVIAEDLVAREPWEQAHIERFRRALVMLRVPHPDDEIAERLSGQTPFLATDPFVDLSEASSTGAEAAAEGPPGAAGEPTGASISEKTAEPAIGRQSAPAASPGDEIDLTSALGNLEAAGTPARQPQEGGLDSVFKRLRETAQGDADYSAQYMTLARTYLEMGMMDEAVNALKTAAQSPRLRFEAASTLGRLLLAQGDGPQALYWLERANEAPAPDADAGWALLYDFGVALDEAGDTPRALALFLELQADAGDYRDVPSRIARLTRVQTGG
jgi:tetratricopeptide (TPR) repeat protein